MCVERRVGAKKPSDMLDELFVPVLAFKNFSSLSDDTSPPLFQYSEEVHATGVWLGSLHECPAGQGEQNDAPVLE